MTIADLTLQAYLDQLASREHAPGGGAAVALTAAQGAALLSMVLTISSGTDTPESSLFKDLDASRQRLLQLATDDGAAFGHVMAAYKLPKGSDEERKARSAAIQSALKQASGVPLATMKLTASLFPLADQVVDTAKVTVISDAAIAVRLIYTALKAGTANVDINLKFLTDKAFRAEAEQTKQDLLEGKKEHHKRLLKQIKKAMRK